MFRKKFTVGRICLYGVSLRLLLDTVTGKGSDSPLPCTLWSNSHLCKVSVKNYSSEWKHFALTLQSCEWLHKLQGSGESGPGCPIRWTSSLIQSGHFRAKMRTSKQHRQKLNTANASLAWLTDQQIQQIIQVSLCRLVGVNLKMFINSVYAHKNFLNYLKLGSEKKWAKNLATINFLVQLPALLLLSKGACK